ncbi:MAG: GNAT family N-acetyltransferase [Eubacteriales bacterium]|nr:GNAT family N-acetyltransferase [Eubacteriales bacterium]MDD4422477.1 GNAT family N-acetyltransferase [Eubacteriales bacterium]HBR31338.1 GNAT family N-acetyltransferase [Clostridiales bacterium]
MDIIEQRFFTEVTQEIRNIREKVFVEEQGFTDEFDQADKTAYHLLLLYNGRAAATGRVFESPRNQTYTIGRVAVLREFRNRHLGKKVMELLEEKAREQGAIIAEVSAQCRARGFYEKNGYTATGDVYYDQHCQHIHMEKHL